MEFELKDYFPNAINFTEWLDKYCKKIGKTKKTLDSKIYAFFLEKVVKPKLDKEYPDLDVVWQDDCSKIHRSSHVLDKVKKIFDERIETKDMAPKMADVWPIQNVWGILNEKLRTVETDDIPTLLKEVKKVWKLIDTDMCAKMMHSIPKRLSAVIKQNGEQIRKKDYF